EGTIAYHTLLRIRMSFVIEDLVLQADRGALVALVLGDEILYPAVRAFRQAKFELQIKCAIHFFGDDIAAVSRFTAIRCQDAQHPSPDFPSLRRKFRLVC